MTARPFVAALGFCAVGALAAGCGRSPGTSAEAEAACQGPPLRSVQARNQAMEDGYEINRRFDCIDKASFAAVAAAKAAQAAARTPEALARQRDEREAMVAEDRARRAAAEERKRLEPPPPPPTYAITRPVDANAASETELASVLSVGASTARQIVEARDQRPFRDWPDLVQRVVGLSAAKPALFASIGGLVVNGRSLDGAPFDPALAAQLDPGAPITPAVAAKLRALGL